MKYEWETKDIKAGQLFHRGGVEEYGASCFHKIGYASVIGYEVEDSQKWVALAMSDGCVFKFGDGTKEDFAKHLTDGMYKPTSAKEAALLIKNHMITREGISND